MSLKKGRKLSKVLLFSGAIIMFFALLMSSDLPEVANYVVGVGLMLFVGGVVATIVLCRCPYCGCIIINGALNRKDCPSCRKKLIGSEIRGKSSAQKRKRR